MLFCCARDGSNPFFGAFSLLLTLFAVDVVVAAVAAVDADPVAAAAFAAFACGGLVWSGAIYKGPDRTLYWVLARPA